MKAEISSIMELVNAIRRDFQERSQLRVDKRVASKIIEKIVVQRKKLADHLLLF
ncbi:MAG: hypothetical protein LBQ43_04745 [Holosporales bacterium]|jgi:hypothetical protein|nr:hypothetical protein [Holosporales bacterium]